MLEFLGDALGAIVSGGATGLLGSAITSFTNYKMQQLHFAHEKDMAQEERHTIELEADKQMEIAKVNGEIEADKIAGEAFANSYTADSAAYLSSAKGPWASFFMGLVDFVRGMTRPTLTAVLVWQAWVILSNVLGLVHGIKGLPADQTLDLAQKVIMLILYLTTTAVLWWFGTRNKIFKPKV